MKKRTLCFGALASILTLSASATDYVVTSALDDGGEGTLRHIIATAESGSTITIPQGMTARLDSRIEVTSAIDLTLVGGGAGATLYGNRESESFTNGMFYVNHAQAKLTFDNLTFTNGFSVANGGVFLVDNCSNATEIVRCTFLANEARGNGGAMQLMAQINLNDCAFTNNFAAVSGGCFYLAMNHQHGANVTRSGVLVSERCDFFGNSAGGTGGIATSAEHSKWDTMNVSGWNCVSNVAARGGCFFLSSPNVIRNSTFEGNAITDNFGSVACVNRGTRTIFDGCRFVRNKATRTGVIFSRVSFSVLNCVFDANFNEGTATTEAWQESATVSGFLNQTTGDRSMVVSNSVFRNNRTALIRSAQNTGAYTVDIADCAFYDAVGSAHAVYLSHAGTVERCFFELNATANPNSESTLLRLVAPSGLTNVVSNCTFSRDPSPPFAHKRRALLIGNTTGVYDIRFCTFVGFRGSEGAVRLSSATESSTSFTGCVFAENGNASTVIDISNAALAVNNCCFMAGASKLTTLEAGTYEDNIFGTDPYLLPLADNEGHMLPDGSYVQTYAFRPHLSPLYNTGGTVNVPATDARGKPRPDRFAKLADIGAYEYQPHNTLMLVR